MFWSNLTHWDQQIASVWNKSFSDDRRKVPGIRNQRILVLALPLVAYRTLVKLLSLSCFPSLFLLVQLQAFCLSLHRWYHRAIPAKKGHIYKTRQAFSLINFTSPVLSWGLLGFFKDEHQLLKTYIFDLWKSNFLGFEPDVGAARQIWAGILTAPVQAAGNSYFLVLDTFHHNQKGVPHLTSGKHSLLGVDIIQTWIW